MPNELNISIIDEQKLIEEQIQEAGYQHKFLAQLHTMKRNSNQRVEDLNNSIESFIDNKVS